MFRALRSLLTVKRIIALSHNTISFEGYVPLPQRCRASTSAITIAMLRSMHEESRYRKLQARAQQLLGAYMTMASWYVPTVNTLAFGSADELDRLLQIQEQQAVP